MYTRIFSGFGLLLAFIFMSTLVYATLDMIATRRVPIHVEDFRETGMRDEEVLVAAVQEAYEIEQNSWWIHDKRPFLVFDDHRTYDIDPAAYASFDLEVTTDANERTIARLRPIAAVNVNTP